MAPPQRYPSPAKQMFELAKVARSEGLDFDAFWERAVRPGQPPLTPRRLGKGAYALLEGAVIWPSDNAELHDAQAAIERSEQVWRRAYNREPATPGDQAIAMLYAIWAERSLGGIESGGAVPLAAV